MPHQDAAPGPLSLQPPALGEVRDGRQRHPFETNAPRGKRGPTNPEAVAGSPRAVRPRHESGHAVAPMAGPFAISRQCNFAERRQRQEGTHPVQPQQAPHPQRPQPPASMHQQEDSWAQSTIDPVRSAVRGDLRSQGAWPQSGSENEHHRIDFNMQGTGYSGYMSQADHGMLMSDRSKRTEGTQTNRESMMRHTQRLAADSSEDEENRPPRGHSNKNQRERSSSKERKAFDGLQKGQGALAFSQLKYPKTSPDITAQSRRVLARAANKAKSSPEDAKNALAQALVCAAKDEFYEMERIWKLGSGEANSVELRVATCLKKLWRRVEESCDLKALAEAGERADTAHEGEEQSVQEQIEELQRQIAASDERISCYKEALARPEGSQDTHKVLALADLSDRINAIHWPNDFEVPGMTEFNQKVDQVIQGMAVTGTACKQLYHQHQDELRRLRDINRDLCPGAAGVASSSEVPAPDHGARSILSCIP